MTILSTLKHLAIATLALAATVANAASTVTYFHNDLAGSPVAATNSSGEVIWRESYRPYGERLNNSSASADNKIYFTSRRQDVETGLVYMGARYYDPVIGRFISTDPKQFDEQNPQLFNRYAYANNNPYKYNDPDGRNPILIAMGIGALIGGGVNAVTQYTSTGTVHWGGLGGVIDAAGDGMLLGLAGARSGAAQSAETNAAKAGVQILERDGNIVVASFQVAKGEARVITEVVRDGDRMILRGTHIEGEGTLKEALSAAKSFGRDQGAKSVVIEGGVRTTGANPGHAPRPITLDTGL